MNPKYYRTADINSALNRMPLDEQSGLFTRRTFWIFLLLNKWNITRRTNQQKQRKIVNKTKNSWEPTKQHTH